MPHKMFTDWNDGKRRETLTRESRNEVEKECDAVNYQETVYVGAQPRQPKA